MRTTKLIPALLFFMLCFTKKHLIAQTEGESFTIYLIRHSEKDILSENQLDPPLTTCGIERSEYLRSFFEDISIKNDHEIKLDVKVDLIENLGFEKIIYAKLSNTQIIIKSSEDTISQPLKISFSKDKVLFFDKNKNRIR